MAIIDDNDRSHIIYGTAGDDIIHGNGGDDEIHGRSGDDTLTGNGGDDWLWGNRGRDVLNGGYGVNDMWGGAGADIFVMGAGSNASSDDWIGDFTFDVDRIDVSGWGASSFDQLRFLFRTDDHGDATLNAFYNGYNHYLTIDGSSEAALAERDFIYSDLGAQKITGTGFDDVLFGSTSDDKIVGRAGADTVLGGDGADILNGSLGDDTLVGGLGQDSLIGSRGGDMLYGGVGADVFVYRSLTDSQGDDSDLIYNFKEGVDQIDVSLIDANHDLDGKQDFDFIGEQGFDAAGQLRVVHENGNTIIYGNVNADSDVDFRIVLEGNVDLSGGDFILS